MNKFIKYTVAVAIAIFAISANAETRDVVIDTNQNYIKNTFNNCVRTMWETGHDKCATAAVAQVVETAPKKPIKRSRSYLVFFDFDKYNITPSALDIIEKAYAESEKSVGEVNFSLTGHADRSGPDDYNMKLSQKRADAVRAALTNLGVQGADISTDFKGEREPLVPTPDGVKEPQNRRVEIIYNIEE